MNKWAPPRSRLSIFFAFSPRECYGGEIAHELLRSLKPFDNPELAAIVALAPLAGAKTSNAMRLGNGPSACSIY